MNKHCKFINTLLILMLLVLAVSSIPFSASAAPAKPVLKNDPMNGQILPFYEVWLRWNDVSNEHHYTMTIRDLGMGGNTGDAGPLIYNQQYVSQNSTYFIVPTSKLTRGHHYRWCLNSVDANGNRTIADQHFFAIEQGNPDHHFIKKDGEILTYPTRVLEYFIYTESSQYDAILESAVQEWNEIANVSLVRTNTPSDGHYELRIYDSALPNEPSTFGRTHNIPKDNSTVVDYSICHTFKENIYNTYSTQPWIFDFIVSYEAYLKPNMMHEIGHALLIDHYNGDFDIRYTLPITNERLVPLIMNSYDKLSPTLNVADRDHLRIKWGA